MNRTKQKLRETIFGLTAVILSAGCAHRQQISNHTVEHVKVDTVAYLGAQGKATPACSLKVDFCYLQPTEGTTDSHEDSVMKTINASLAAQLLGEDYASLSATEAVHHFADNYLNDYRQDMQELFTTDLKNRVPEDELPSWYNRSFDMTTRLNDGRDGILCAATDIYEFAGGAHPNSWVIWLNYRLNDGHLLTTDEVFLPTLQTEVSEHLLDALLAWARKKLDNSHIQNISDLQHEGVLLTSELYVPENFLLEKDKVRFVYNKYDIAPYSMGAIELEIPYEEISEYMDLEF